MLQLRRIRSFTKNGTTKSYDTNFSPDILIESHAELFANLEKYVGMIPDYERFNCHYTQGHCSGGKTRGSGTFERQSLVAFDVDGITFSGDKHQNAKYANIFFEVTKCDREKTVIVFSGHGLHFITQIPEWTDKKFFKDHGEAYAAICTALEERYRSESLIFKEVDRACFAPNRMLRLPNTYNVKEGKEKILCKIISGKLSEQPNFLAMGKSKKATKPKQTEQKKEASSEPKYPKIDSEAVLIGCDFLKSCKASPASVTEDQWYASLSVLGRLDDGKALAHEYSKGHSGYSVEETDGKLDYALKTPPRTCEDIGKRWKGCADCKYYGKVTTPVMIRSEEFIATAEQGFYFTDEKGKRHPAYDDLIKHFTQINPFVVNEDSARVHAFDGKKYVNYPKNKVRGFAGTWFDPQPNEHVIQEFCGRITRLNQVASDFFDTAGGLINFNNGVLDIKSKKFLCHSKDFGFQYVLPYDYDVDAKCPNFDAMMKRVTCDDSELEELLLEFAGYAICEREYKHHKAMILIGEGANGKSTFLDVIKELVGKGNFSAIGIKEMEMDTKRAMLEGKLVNISDEMPNMSMSDTDTFKKMMGGDITIKSVFEKPTTIRCTTKLMFAANEIPSTFDQSKGFKRRIILAPFNASFEGQNVDRKIMDKIKKELPGVFNRVLAAFERLEARGDFIACKRSEKELLNYMEDNDVLGTFIKHSYDWVDSWDENCPGVPMSIIMSDFIDYAKSLNEKTAHVNVKRMGLALTRNIPNCEKRKKRIISAHGKRENVYLGLRRLSTKNAQYANGNGLENGGKDWISQVESGLGALGQHNF